MKTVENYLTWLEQALNSAAQYCSSYTRENDEFPPDDLYVRYRILRGAWDSYKVIVEKDTAYRHAYSLAEPFVMDETLPEADQYAFFLNKVLSEIYGYNAYLVLQSHLPNIFYLEEFKHYASLKPKFQIGDRIFNYHDTIKVEMAGYEDIAGATIFTLTEENTDFFLFDNNAVCHTTVDELTYLGEFDGGKITKINNLQEYKKDIVPYREPLQEKEILVVESICSGIISEIVVDSYNYYYGENTDIITSENIILGWEHLSLDDSKILGIKIPE